MPKNMSKKALSRFATMEEAMSDEFMAINYVLNGINVEYKLPDHSDLNKERYPWSVGLLSVPSLYAARMWEYPFAILSGDLTAGMKCLDVGCGMTPFTVYLQNVAKCDVVGLDPDVFAVGIKYKSHGVNREFMENTGLRIEKGGIEHIPFPSGSFERLFCLSVIEHLPFDVIRRGADEIRRVLSPGGKAIITVDVNMFSELCRPLDVVWDSGLIPIGAMDLRWPFKRFGIFCDKKQPADVFGMTLGKPENYYVETVYEAAEQEVNTIHGSLIPSLRKPSDDFRLYIRLLKLYRVVPYWLKGFIRWLIRKGVG